MSLIMVYITCKDKNEAEKISKLLIGKRLIACANIFPISSIYKWKAKLVKEKETALLAKSTDQKFDKIVAEVKRVHSYKIPCIEKINTVANKDFEKWVFGEIR